MKPEYLYVTIAIFSWGSSATIVKLFFRGLDTNYVIAVSLFLSFLCMLLLLAVQGKLRLLKALDGKTLARMLGIGILGVYLYNYFYQMGVGLLPAQQAFVINYLWPALIIVFSRPILGEPYTPSKLFAVALAFLGVALVATNGDLGTLLGGQRMGILYSLLAAVCYGLYSPLAKKQTYDPDLALMIVFGATAVWCLFLSVRSGTVCMPTAFQWVGLVLFGVVVNALAYMFWVKALSCGNTAVMSNLIYLTPIVSLVFTHVVLGEEITFWSVFGLLLICLGAAVQMWGQSGEAAKGRRPS